ncbi:MAG: septal ring lytic transglycosylase RlpA family protein [bacterium]
MQNSSVGTYTPGNKSPYMVFGKTYEVLPDSLGYLEIGVASWYGKKFHGRLTSNGETYDMYKLSAAHKSLPLPTVVKVTNLDNGKQVILRVNDRGPFHDDRVIDLSYETAIELGFADKGTAPVVVEALDEVNYPRRSSDPEPGQSLYLQLGAFSQLVGAEKLRNRIDDLMSEHQLTSIPVNILQTETSTAILHKVWLGPIPDAGKREQIVALVMQAELGTPLEVGVD